MSEAIDREVIKLIEQFNETGEIDTIDFIHAVEAHLLLKNHVYILNEDYSLNDLGVITDHERIVERDTIDHTVRSTKPNGFTRQLRRNPDGTIKDISL